MNHYVCLLIYIRYTQRQIFMRKPIKEENLFFFEMIGSLLSFVHHLCLSTNSKWGYYLYFTTSNLFESTKSLVSLAPTRRKHQLPECSSTNWMEAPTSSYTGTNLYNREQLFSLAPAYHPGFSGCNQMEATTPYVQAPTWTSKDNSPP